MKILQLVTKAGNGNTANPANKIGVKNIIFEICKQSIA
jgi:hypothetical protein